MVEDVFSIIVSISPFVCLLGVYLLLFLSPNKAKKGLNVNELSPGDKVITTGGIVGYIAKINHKTVILENYDGTLLEIHHTAVREKIT